MDPEEKDLQEGQESPEQKAGKDEKKFNDGLDKLTSLLSGDTSAKKKPKVKNDRVGALVEKINEERTKKLEEEFVADGIKLLDQWAIFDNECTEEEKRFKAAIAAKKKDFLGKMNNLFGKLESIDKINGQYKASLKKVIPDNQGNQQ